MDHRESDEKHVVRSNALLIDGMNLFLRHFAANPTTSLQGAPMGGVVGMMRALGTLCDMFRPVEMIVVWEGGGSSRRRHIYPNYKGKRKPVRLNRFHAEIPDTVGNRDDQVKTLIGCLRSTGIKQLYVEDCEADDVIAYMSRRLADRHRIIIVSSDKDYYQLLDDDVVIYNPGSKSLVTRQYVVEKFNGITPANFALAKALSGDGSDNISGVKGVGFKTAARLFPMLCDDDCHELHELVEHAKVQLTSKKKLKTYVSVVSEAISIEKYLRLIVLDGSMLDADQRRRIDYQYDSFESSRNKLDLMRTLISMGLNAAFDVEAFFHSTSILNLKMRTT